ncbi:MAG: AAA family ATPase [Lachnospiraceae bacterium]|nr:AAA family ATPase [Lachnospiraceae bacterium]
MAEGKKQIRVRLFGTPGVYAGEGTERIHFPYRKAEGIFYYLCVNKSALRDELINVFWEECDEQTGRKNLRQALYELKKVLPVEPVKAEGQNRLFLDEDTVKIEDAAMSDEEIFLKGKEFLHYFYVKGAPGFDEWVNDRRQEIRDRSRNTARKLISETVRIRDIKKLHEVLTAWHRLEPYEEYVVREAMEAYSACGQYNMAIQTYQDYQELIARELEEEPGEELASMYRQIFRLKENDTGAGALPEKRFYCRYPEIYDLSRTLDRFTAGTSAVSVVIAGEFGVGKTALLTHMSKMAPGKKTMYFLTHCYETEKEYYLKGFREWFKWLEKYDDEGRLSLSKEHEELLHQLFSDRYLRVDEERPAVFGASTYAIWEDSVISMFREITDRKKIVLFIDDMQWMDDLSRQLLWRLVLELEGKFCFIATYRTGEEERNLDFLRRAERRELVRFIKLMPFTEEETAEIIGNEIPSASAGMMASKIWQRTEGNALFLMDLLNMIRDEGWDSGSIPPKSEYIIRARLRNITPVQKQILCALSIFMEHAELYELEILVDMDRLSLCEELEALEKHRIVQELVVGEYIAYEFRHHYYKEYVYNGQPLAKRRHMHYLVAKSYEKLKDNKRWLEHLPFIIYQFEKAGEQEAADRYRSEYESESDATVISDTI